MGNSLASHIKIRLGVTSTYLISGHRGYLLVDGGPMGKGDLFFKRLDKAGIQPSQISLVVLTHAHYDHAGCLSDIKGCCGCPVMAHSHEAFLLKNPVFRLADPDMDHLPTVDEFQGYRFVRREKSYRFAPVTPEYIIDGAISLEDFGFDARVVLTPGHTPGSLSVITHEGDAFIGDLAINTYPFGAGAGFPQYSFDMKLQVESWYELKAMGVRMVFPGHGRPFNPQKFNPEFV